MSRVSSTLRITFHGVLPVHMGDRDSKLALQVSRNSETRSWRSEDSTFLIDSQIPLLGASVFLIPVFRCHNPYMGVAAAAVLPSSTESTGSSDHANGRRTEIDTAPHRYFVVCWRYCLRRQGSRGRSRQPLQHVCWRSVLSVDQG